MSRTVLISIDDNAGYAPEQIETPVTLADVLESIQEAIKEFGEDAKVVLFNGQRYGAGFGKFQTTGGYSELNIGDAEPDDEDEDI